MLRRTVNTAREVSVPLADGRFGVPAPRRHLRVIDFGEDPMRYTVWHRDILIGETDFELGRRGGSRAGVLHPTPSGLAVLPALTAMAPALLAIGETMKRLPLSDEDIDRDVDGAIEAFTTSPEGQRVLRAAEEMADLELRDDGGRSVFYDSILVSDLHEMTSLGAGLRAAAPVGDPVRYVISATFDRPTRSAIPGPH